MNMQESSIRSSSAGDTSVSTFGWDTAYVASFPVVNAAILAQKSYPTKFNYTDDAGITIEGVWKSWQLSVGGAGQNVQMTCLVDSGSVSGLNQSGDLKDASLIIQVNLTQVAAEDPVNDPTTKANSGSSKALVVNTKGVGSDPAVSVLSTSSFPNVSSSLLLDLLDTVFANYFNANIGDFNHTFAVMNIGEEADQDGFQWLKPTAYQYAVASPENGTLENSAFGLIAMVDNNAIDPYQQQAVDSRALMNLPSDANSAFVISENMVAKHMLMNGAITTIQGSTASDFTLSADGLSVTNANDLTWGHFQTDDGVISPKITKGNFVLRADDTYVYLEINNAVYSPSAGITVHMNLSQKFSFKTVKRSDGKYVFVPDETGFGSPQYSSNVSLSEGLQITELITGIVASIAGLLCAASAIGSALAASAEVEADAADEAANVAIDAEEAEAAAAENPEALNEANEDGAEDADDGANDPENANQVQRSGIFTSTKFRLVTGLIGAISGLTSGGIACAKAINELNYDDIPAFDDFAANCLGASQWPLMDDYSLQSASFRSSLVIATTLKQSSN